MNDSPYRSPNADEMSEPVSPTASTSWTRTVYKLLLVVGILMVVIFLLLPTQRGGREAARRSNCSNNLKQIGVALHNYSVEYGALPPAYTVDADGNRLHSWRTLILPYLEQGTLYDSIDLSKPWDDPVNAQALQTKVRAYQCRSVQLPANQTNYLAIVAPGSCLGAEPRKLADITDGTSETLLVLEVDAEQAVPWMSPHDADEALVLGLGPESNLPHRTGVQGVLVDGSVRFIPADLPANQRRALISIAGNDEVSPDTLD